MVFAVCDAAERFPAAGRLLIENFERKINSIGLPEDKSGWLELVNEVYALQDYNHKTTFSCAALKWRGDALSAFIIHGGDSVIISIDVKSGKMKSLTSPDMRFAGRAQGILQVDEAEIANDDCRLIIASDGLADIAKLSGGTLESVIRSVSMRNSIQKIPDRFLKFIDGLPEQAEYDDVGVILLAPTALFSMDSRELSRDGVQPIIIGGTSPAEETHFRNNVSAKIILDVWEKMEYK